ncbi:MAG: helix-turn-helix domain-containing protein [Actinomycetales bacterium]|nr:helix-turn-helix domain-containing protein [Actinomycetales bacterium]
MLVELSVMEQRYQAVSFVVHDGESVVEVARRFNVSRQTVHAWLARYERGGLAALVDRSHRPKGCAHQMPAGLTLWKLSVRARPIPSSEAVC